MGRFLLIYSSLHRAQTTALVQSLRQAGHRMLVMRADSTDIRWQEAARQSKNVLVVVSPAALQEASIQQKLADLQQMQIKPLAVAVQPVGNALYPLQGIDLYPNTQIGIKNLLAALSTTQTALGRTRGIVLPLLTLLVFLILLSAGVVWAAAAGMERNTQVLPTLDQRVSMANTDPAVPSETAMTGTLASEPRVSWLEAAAAHAITPEIAHTPDLLEKAITATPTDQSDDSETVDDIHGAFLLAGTAVTSTPDITDAKPPVADFFAYPLRGEVPLSVTVENDSWGDIVSYAWDFTGDGIIDSTSADPSGFTYTGEGVYTITLRVTGQDGHVDQKSMQVVTFAPNAGRVIVPTPRATIASTPTVIAPEGPPVAEFYAFPDRGEVPLTVEFVNDSWGGIVSYAWDFNGDGITDSTSQNPPPYIYMQEGTFNAMLRVIGADGRADQMVVQITTFGWMPPPTSRPPATPRPLPTAIPIMPLTPDFTPTATLTRTATPTATATATATESITPVTATATQTTTPLAESTEPVAPTSTVTTTATAAATLTSTATASPTLSPTSTSTVTATVTPTVTFTSTSIPVPTITPVPPTETPVPTLEDA